jgi:hypothetical protein
MWPGLSPTKHSTYVDELIEKIGMPQGVGPRPTNPMRANPVKVKDPASMKMPQLPAAPSTKQLMPPVLPDLPKPVTPLPMTSSTQ